VPTNDDVKALREAVEQKADLDRVPTVDELQALRGDVEHKSNQDRLRTADDMQALRRVAELKANKDSVATNNNFQALCEIVDENANQNSPPAATSKIFARVLTRRRTATAFPPSFSFEHLWDLLRSRRRAASVPDTDLKFFQALV